MGWSATPATSSEPGFDSIPVEPGPLSHSGPNRYHRPTTNHARPIHHQSACWSDGAAKNTMSMTGTTEAKDLRPKAILAVLRTHLAALEPRRR